MFVIIVITYLCCCVFRPSLVQSQCVSPPLECPNENITFWLYTRKSRWMGAAQDRSSWHSMGEANNQQNNENTGHQVMVNDSESIKQAPWVPDAPIKILIHGYTGDKDYSPNKEIRPAYLECCNYNLLSVDYNPIAREPCYPEAARNTELVGKCIAQLICKLVKDYNFTLDQFHLIGFSLGGQALGYVGNYMSCGQLNRMTALDPAMPLFVTNDKNKKVDKSDAKFVDILHTDSLSKGKLEASGHVDFYANGGMSQPGCKETKEQTKSGCNHGRAPMYYAESINTDVGFYSTKCYSWITYMIGWCELFNSHEDILFGEYVPWNATGIYFFSTNDKAPYAKGSKKKQKRSIELSKLNLRNILPSF